MVANCNIIKSPYFCFQNCNKCWIVFPKLTLIGMSCFLISVCSGGISTLHASHVCPSQFSMPLPWPHPQLLMFPLFPIFRCHSHPILLFIHPFKNQTWTWSRTRLLDCQIGSVIYQRKSIFQLLLKLQLKCKCISFMIQKEFSILLWITSFLLLLLG